MNQEDYELDDSEMGSVKEIFLKHYCKTIAMLFEDIACCLTIFKYKSLLNDDDLNDDDFSHSNLYARINENYDTINELNISNGAFTDHGFKYDDNDIINIFNENIENNIKSYVSNYIIDNNKLEEVLDFIDSLSIDNIKEKSYTDNIISTIDKEIKEDK